MRSISRTLLVGLLALGAGATASSRAEAQDAAVVVDVGIFYEALEPHGSWVWVAPYGWAWQPRGVDVSWRPYVDNGYWVWLDEYGWTWYSDYEWGWAPFHYGRWFFHGLYGWLWVPGPVWAPAWVGWRVGPGWVGWLPLPPEVEYRDSLVIAVDFASPTYAYWWSFVPTRWFVDVRLGTRIVASPWNGYLLARTQDSTRYATGSFGVVNRSVELATVEKAGVRVTRRALREAASPGAKAEPNAVALYRPRVKAGASSRQPKAAPRDAAALAQRRKQVEQYLEQQKKALDGDAPEGIPAEEAKKARDEQRKKYEEHKKRVVEDAAKTDEAPPPGKGGEPPKPPDQTPPKDPDGPRPPKPTVPDGPGPTPPKQPPAPPPPPTPPGSPPGPEQPPPVPPEKPEKPEKPKDGETAEEEAARKQKEEEERKRKEKEEKDKDKGPKNAAA